MSNPPAFSVVAPALNEAPALASMIPELFDRLDGGDPFEVVIVDDGGSDGTAELVASLMREERHQGRLRVVSHRRRAGQSAALRTGVAHARGEWIVTMDGDGQSDPADIAAMRRAAGVGVLVCGVREKRAASFSKRMGSRIANMVRAWALGDGCPDSACGFKVFRRDEFLALPAFDGLHRFLPALFKARGAEIRLVSVVDRDRRHGVSKYTNRGRALRGLVDLFGVAWLNARAVRVHEPSEAASSALAAREPALDRTAQPGLAQEQAPYGPPLSMARRG